MKAVVLGETGGPEQLVYGEAPDPEPRPGNVLVSVRAAGINFADVLVRLGRYPQPPDLPAVLGSELAGEIVGRGADGLREGERVFGLTGTPGGAYAELAEADPRWLVPLPAGASFSEGAAFLTAFLTAWLPLTRQVRVREGSVVLVHAAAGGVGSAAVQVARHLGARVVATAGSAEKLALAGELGAELTIDYRSDDFVARVREELDGVDIVVDPVGGPVLVESLKALRPLGVAIAIGFAGGPWQPLDPALLVGRNIGVQGFYLGRLMSLAPELVQEAIGEVVELWRQGAVRPVVGGEYPFAEAAEAHRSIEDRKSVGKVLLTA
ncbi:MAG: NADPH:quinone oxidoreductase family protein [Actinobacteria bacterium]|nr:NADPH:quinone oxidoreductase family protein [Actinomycetota bacterium]